MTPLYYECHITLDPVSGDRLELLKSCCSNWDFRVADLLMKNGETSNIDSFCTGKDDSYFYMHGRMCSLIDVLLASGFVVRRYKIEAALTDVRIRLERPKKDQTPKD